MPKIIKLGWCLTDIEQKISWHVIFWDTVYTRISSLSLLKDIESQKQCGFLAHPVDFDACLTHLFVWLSSYTVIIWQVLLYCDFTTQVARVLLAVEKGRLHEFAGKSLDNIDASGMFYTAYHHYFL